MNIINQEKRIQANCRRLKFEVLKSIGIFWIIDNICFLKLKEPWNKLYKRENK